MRIKLYIFSILLLLLSTSLTSVAQTKKQKDSSPKYKIKECLNRPFGTCVKLKVQIIDGESLRTKEYSSDFLLLVKQIENEQVHDTLIMKFMDESRSLPAGDFDLYEYTFGKKTGTLTSDTLNLIKKNYVGREYEIIAYESGFFYGTPDGYNEYQLPKQEPSFHFRNYLIVIANLTKKK